MIDRKTVEYVAELARLKLTEEEINYFQGQLSRVLDYFEELKNTKGVVAKSGELLETPERSDQVIPSLPVEILLEQAPRKIGSAFQVPRIIEA